MPGVSGKKAIVTGAGGGIGKEICSRLSSAGCNVALFDINGPAATSVAASLSGITTSVHEVDVADYEAVGKAVAKAEAALGGIDILINNAGWDIAKPFIDTEPNFWDKVISINYKGPLNLHHHVLPRFVAQGTGKVVNISSDAGRVGSTGEAVYAGCKAALAGFGKSIARELAKNGICINTVCPGPTDTPLFEEFAGEGEFGKKVRSGLKKAIPMRRLGQATDIAGVVVFLVSNEADFITGQTISVSGGLTMHG